MRITVARTPADLEAFRGGVVVPTMGALHAGHGALIEHASRLAGDSPVVATIFVNPTQFNESRDFDTYPRDLEHDLALAAGAGATCVFAPDVDTVYPAGRDVPVPDLPPVATEPGLEDAHRPGHFQGVCQVVARLFDLTSPTRALFGEKDWQQLAVVRAMARATHPGTEIVGSPTVREAGGLAMSSRNQRLGAADRRRASAISAALAEASRWPSSTRDAEANARRVLLENDLEAEYCVIRDAETLLEASPGRPARALIAAPLGDARLIDNAPWPGFAIPAGA